MIYSLHGELIHTEPNLAVVECGGVGYACRTTMNTLKKIGGSGEVRLFTQLNVREDAIDLFGFADTAELQAFRQLTSISGVGPKAALAILSDLTPSKLALCITTGDSKTLTRSPGSPAYRYGTERQGGKGTAHLRFRLRHGACHCGFGRRQCRCGGYHSSVRAWIRPTAGSGGAHRRRP